MKPQSQLNKELTLAHQFIKQQYQTYINSNSIKSDQERRAYAHAVHILEYVAHNCNITPKHETTKHKKTTPPHKEQTHTELYNMATTD